MQPTAALKAGLAYFAIVFAAGFLVGTIRVLAVIPSVGELAAVLIELPLMLALSWLVAGWLIRRLGIAARLRPRIVMGATAFVLLMLAEFGLAALVFGRSASEHLAGYGELPARIGLAGQLAFAAMPAIWLLREKRATSTNQT